MLVILKKVQKSLNTYRSKLNLCELNSMDDTLQLEYKFWNLSFLGSTTAEYPLVRKKNKRFHLGEKYLSYLLYGSQGWSKCVFFKTKNRSKRFKRLKHHFFSCKENGPKNSDFIPTIYHFEQFFYSFWMFLLKFNKFQHRKSSASLNSWKQKNTPADK